MDNKFRKIEMMLIKRALCCGHVLLLLLKQKNDDAQRIYRLIKNLEIVCVAENALNTGHGGGHIILVVFNFATFLSLSKAC